VSDSFSARMIEAAKAYFAAVDGGRLPDELFARDSSSSFRSTASAAASTSFTRLAAGLRPAAKPRAIATVSNTWSAPGS
jgi:hypothetical protein